MRHLDFGYCTFSPHGTHGITGLWLPAQVGLQPHHHAFCRSGMRHHPNVRPQPLMRVTFTQVRGSPNVPASRQNEMHRGAAQFEDFILSVEQRSVIPVRPSPFFPGILLSRKPPQTQENRIRFLKRTMVEKNGKGINP